MNKNNILSIISGTTILSPDVISKGIDNGGGVLGLIKAAKEKIEPDSEESEKK